MDEFLDEYNSIDEIRYDNKRIETDKLYKELYYNDYYDEYYYGTDFYSFIY